MTPNELYARADYEISHCLSLLFPCNGFSKHLPEIADGGIYGFQDQEEVVFRVYKDFDFDGRRFWRLASVWLNGKPVMILQNAGREGTDHCERFITDVEAYKALVKTVQKYVIPDPTEPDIEDIVSPDDERPGLIEFYGSHLDGHFARYR